MRLWLSVARIAAASVVIAAFAPAPPRLDNVFSPVLEAGALRAIEVEARFRGRRSFVSPLASTNGWPETVCEHVCACWPGSENGNVGVINASTKTSVGWEAACLRHDADRSTAS
jgi:hypothetical protein